MSATTSCLNHFLGVFIRRIAHIRRLAEIRNPKISKSKVDPKSERAKRTGLKSFSRVIGSSYSSSVFLLSRKKIMEESINKKIDPRKPKNPGPGIRKLPIPSFRLIMKINEPKEIKKRLITRLNTLIYASTSVLFFRTASIPPASSTSSGVPNRG